MSSDDIMFYAQNKTYIDGLSKEPELCPDCTRQLDSHTSDSSVCISPW